MKEKSVSTGLAIHALTVVIPTKGRGGAILAAVQSVVRQSLKVSEIVIVDGSTEEMDVMLFDQILLDFEVKMRVCYCHAPEDKGLTAARNRGVQLATGDIIQFLDDDAILADDYFEKIVPLFEDQNVGGVSGLVIEPSIPVSLSKKLLFNFFYTGPFRQDRERHFLNPGDSPVKSNTLPGVSAYRRSVFDSITFDEYLTGPCVGEDVDFSYRLGKDFQLLILPVAKIFHFPSKAGRQSVRNSFSSKVVFYHYHFRKNLAKSDYALICYLWLNCGFVLHSISKLNIDAVFGVISGIVEVMKCRRERIA